MQKRASHCVIIARQLQEPQNCKGWKGPLEIIESNPPAPAGSLQSVTEGYAQMGLLHPSRDHTALWDILQNTAGRNGLL